MIRPQYNPAECAVADLPARCHLRHMGDGLTVLGIETSCDETAVAVAGNRPHPHIRANLIHSQLAEHAPYGGVVPEVAARAHLDLLRGLIERALAEAETNIGRIDAVAAACGPGLIGGLIVGSMAAKGLAWAAGKPFIAVNHLEAHALAARLSDDVAFPYLLLLVSGGHTQLLACTEIGQYRQLGASRDDAAGEAFDKTAKLLGLGYPGGPAIERAARDGDPRRYALPRPLKGRPGCDFSFSGLKTAVRQTRASTPADVRRSRGGDRVGDLRHAGRPYRQCHRLVPPASPGGTSLVAAGGVAANQRLRARLAALAERRRARFCRAAAGAVHR